MENTPITPDPNDVQAPEPEPTQALPGPDQANDPQPDEPAIFQDGTEFTHVDDSWPACLSNPTSGFWDNPTFI